MTVFPFTLRAARRHSLAFLLACSFLAASLPFGSSQAQSPDAGETAAHEPLRATTKGPRHAEFVPGEVLVRFRSDAAAKGVEAAGVAALRSFDGQEIDARVERFGGSDLVEGLRLATVDPDQTLEAIAALNARPDVLYAEPDYIVREAALPNDPRFPEMYGLRNTGQSGGTPGAHIDAERAWDITQGSSDVVVGVVDGGIDINHPDLRPNLWTNPGEVPGNGVDDDGNGFTDDINGWDFLNNDNSVYDSPTIDRHGTHVAGTIGAAGNNGVGVTGVNWRVSLLSLKFIGASTGSTSNAIRAAAYAKALRDKWLATGGTQGANVRVLNNSYGGDFFSQSEIDGIRVLNSSGILFVAAAGNDGTDNDIAPHYPSSYDAPNVISVAATDRTDGLSSFSNSGVRTVHLGAPGSSILSTTPNNTYSFFSGTSMSTPHVTGAAALILSRQPDISIAQLRGALIYSGDALASLNGRTYTQRRLNAHNALLSAAENDTTAPAAVSNLRLTAQNGRAITVAWTAPGDDGNSGQAALYEVSFVSGTSGATFILNTFIPNPAGTSESFVVDVPLRQTSGSIRVKAIDNVGNESPSASVNVTIDLAVADPYTTGLSANTGLVAPGAPLNFRADDAYRDYTLPFAFPFYGQPHTSLVISTNGTLYFQPQSTLPPAPPSGCCGDAGSSVEALDGFRMIAGLWDDIRTDSTGGDVFVNTSDPDKVIFRWEGRRFAGNNPDSGPPVQFEIELRRDGTIQIRYGAGNTGVTSVVGIGGGSAGSAYVINSHTSPRPNPGINLTNAQTVTFALRPVSAGPPLVSFNTPSISVSESQASATLTIIRSGELSGTSTINYATVDNPAAVRCDDTTTAPGVAFARCDYATSIDTVTFAPGQSSQQIQIPIIDDGHVEPNEAFQVTLNNPSPGSGLGAVPSISVTIIDNDVAGAANPVNTTPFFVRQQYLDFLSREPEAGEPWSAILNGCPNPFNLDPNSGSANCDRILVSASFFGSDEFRLKGFYVFIHYRVAFSERFAAYSEIVADMRAVTGTTPADTFARRAQFPVSFTGRQEFRNRYDALTPQGFVDALLERYAVQQITTPDPAVAEAEDVARPKIVLTRAELVNRLTSGVLTRAQVLRAIVESDEVGAAEFNRAFVAMQYYGYLRRTPDEGGYQTWLIHLAANPNDSRTMVNGFMNSPEYRLRFGQP